jgi:hypothetical protein
MGCLGNAPNENVGTMAAISCTLWTSAFRRPSFRGGAWQLHKQGQHRTGRRFAAQGLKSRTRQLISAGLGLMVLGVQARRRNGLHIDPRCHETPSQALCTQWGARSPFWTYLSRSLSQTNGPDQGNRLFGALAGRKHRPSRLQWFRLGHIILGRR